MTMLGALIAKGQRVADHQPWPRAVVTAEVWRDAVGGLANGALFTRLNGLAFGEPLGAATPDRMSYLPIFAHFALVLIAGIWLPPAIVAWFQNVAGLLG